MLLLLLLLLQASNLEWGIFATYPNLYPYLSSIVSVPLRPFRQTESCFPRYLAVYLSVGLVVVATAVLMPPFYIFCSIACNLS